MIRRVATRFASSTVRPMFCGAAGLGFGSLIILSSTGCHKASPPASNISAAESNAVSAAQAHEPVYSQTPANTAPVVTSSGEPDLGELNRSLLRWMMTNRRKPASFEDFSATANVAIPPPPAGKKYTINPSTMHIVLVNK